MGRHLPGLQPHLANVPIRELLQARSGLEQDLFRYTDRTPNDHFPRLGDLLDVATRVEARAVPGERVMWTGPEGVATDAVLLAGVVEELSGRSCESFVAERIFVPLGMRDSGFLTQTRPVADLARPYQRLFALLEPFPSTDYSYLRPNGGIYSTAADAVRFLRGVFERRELGPGAREAMELELGRGLLAVREGRMIRDRDEMLPGEGRAHVDTNGWTRGTTLLLSYFPERGDLLLALSNVHRAAEIYDLRRRWMRLVFGLEVGMPLPKTQRRLWQLLTEEGVDAAVRFFEEHRALGTGPDLPFPDEFMHHSRELRRRGRFDEARRVTELYLALEPEFWLPYREMGEVLRMGGDLDGAARYFRRALELNPGNADWKADMETFLAGRSGALAGNSTGAAESGNRRPERPASRAAPEEDGSRPQNRNTRPVVASYWVRLLPLVSTAGPNSSGRSTQ